MAIQAKDNDRYGGPLVTQKYRPLEDVTIDKANRAACSWMLSNRHDLLTAMGNMPRPLTLFMQDWDAAVDAEANRTQNLPPLIVISSNRSNWIRAGLNAAQVQANLRGVTNFRDPGDPDALRGTAPAKGPEPTQSPPLYSPLRLGANPQRSVYIVINIAEYAGYRKALAGTGVTPVGYWFTQLQQTANHLERQIAGFGASRYAAIEFCKELRRRVRRRQSTLPPPPTPPTRSTWDWAWLMDDNAVGLKQFPGLAVVEAQAEAQPTDVVIGFGGGAKAETMATIIDQARKAGPMPTNLGPDTAPGLVQQVSVWNIDYLDRHNTNFPPIYATSGEDVSMVNLFNKAGTPYRFYDTVKIMKEIVEEEAHDNSTGSGRVKKSVLAFARRFVQAEEADTPQGAKPPPPVEIEPKDGSGVQKVQTFVVDKVLKGSADDAAQVRACCQAVEQITLKAIELGLVSATALQQTFQINGAGTPQAIRCRDVP